MFSYKANGMAVINHNQRIVFISKITYTFQIADDSVHREHTVCCDQFDSCACFICSFQLCFQVFHIVVFITETFCFAETYSVDDGCVIQFITDDCIFCCQDRLKKATVCIKAGRVKNRVIGSEEAGDLLLELFMNVLCSTDKTDRCNSVSLFIICFLCCFNQTRAVSQSKIVICTHAKQLSAVFHLYSSSLRRNERSLAFKKSCFLNVLYFFCINT